MERVDTFKRCSLVQYFGVFMLILTSGTAVRSIYGEIVCCLFVFASFVVYYKNKENWKVITSNFVVLCILVGSFVFNYLIHMQESPSLGAYIAFILSIIGTFFLVEGMTLVDFQRLFVNILGIMSACSLMLYGMAYIFPLTAYVYVSPASETAKLFLLHNYYAFDEGRNCGAFNEPGLYAVILCLAILFVLQDESRSSKQKAGLIILFSVTVITTVSTTGYIVLAIELLPVLQKMISLQKSITMKMLIMLLVLPIAALMVFKLYYSDAFYSKVILGKGSFGTRSNDLTNSFFILGKYMNFGTGINTTTMINEYMYYGHANNSVGLLATMIYMGLWYGVFYIATVVVRTFRQMKNPVILLLSILIFSLSQSILQYPMCFMFLFYFKHIGMNENRGPQVYTESKQSQREKPL